MSSSWGKRLHGQPTNHDYTDARADPTMLTLREYMFYIGKDVVAAIALDTADEPNIFVRRYLWRLELIAG